ncbi:MAG TPA: M20 family metallopeptidase [Tepidisphaeraceae bacterium]|nr:M20 family metallopeptidase [Tepidisphaeraceae bacterium]
MSIESLIQQALPRAIEIRRTIHSYPELGYDEHETAAIIRAELTRLSIDFVAGIDNAPTATVALIGDSKKPCVALRADIDALPIHEQTGASYASKRPGLMHACGHDGHTANLLGTAAVLKGMEKDLNRCVKLIFQPAEEGGAGADRLVKAGALDGRIGPKVEVIYGLHGLPGLPHGLVSSRVGALLASTDTFVVKFIGRGCHGAFPHLGRDPIVAAAEAVISLQQVVSRELDPTEPGVVTVGQFHAGTAENVIPDEAMIEGTIRTLDPKVRTKLAEAVKRRCEHIAMSAGCQAVVSIDAGYPTTINHAAPTRTVESIARKHLGEDKWLTAARPVMGGEDFAYYLEAVPGCFFMVGVSKPGQPVWPLHSDRYDFPDDALPSCMRMFVELAVAE